jgi:DHA1 family bicyclomycin/chloramphenicol resistance-like MFS transporter
MARFYPYFGFMCFVGLGKCLTIPNATTGMLSVRPHLAWTTSVLGSAIIINVVGACGAVVSMEAGKTPLLLLMETSAILDFATMLLVLPWQHQLAKQESPATGSDRTQPHP